MLLHPYAQGTSVQMRGVLPIGAFWGSKTENCNFCCQKLAFWAVFVPGRDAIWHKM